MKKQSLTKLAAINAALDACKLVKAATILRGLKEPIKAEVLEAIKNAEQSDPRKFIYGELIHITGL